MPRESAQELEKVTVDDETYEFARHVFPICIRLARIDKQDVEQEVQPDVRTGAQHL